MNRVVFLCTARPCWLAHCRTGALQVLPMHRRDRGCVAPGPAGTAGGRGRAVADAWERGCPFDDLRRTATALLRPVSVSFRHRQRPADYVHARWGEFADTLQSVDGANSRCRAVAFALTLHWARGLSGSQDYRYASCIVAVFAPEYFTEEPC